MLNSRIDKTSLSKQAAVKEKIRCFRFFLSLSIDLTTIQNAHFVQCFEKTQRRLNLHRKFCIISRFDLLRL